MKLLSSIGIGEKPAPASAYLTWASGFKVRIIQAIERLLGRAGYDAGKLLRSLRDKAEQWWYFQGPSRGATG